MNRFLSFYYQLIKPRFLDKPLYSESTETPFFILSAGRSGSTLLRKLLLINTSVNIPPESDDLVPKLVKFYLTNNHKSWDNIVEGCIEIFKKEDATALWCMQPEYEKLLSYFHKDKSLAGIISGIYSLYAESHNLNNVQWGDKTPFLIFRFSWIDLIYPNAKYIFLVRDGRAVVNSFLKMNKDYSMETAIRRWKNSNLIIKERIRDKSEQCLLLKYEDLINNTSEILNQVYTFLKVEPMENRRELFMGDDILWHHRNIHSEISTLRINSWEKELNNKQIEFITQKMEKELKEFNYL